MKRQIHVTCDKDLLDLFQRLYPSTLTRFIQQALKLACKDKELFMKIFFSNLEEK